MKKDAAEWARELGIIILDPDGWRKRSPYGALSTDVPITREDFDRRAAISTTGPRIPCSHERTELIAGDGEGGIYQCTNCKEKVVPWE